MMCPHCRTAFFEEWESEGIGRDKDGFWQIRKTICAACKQYVFVLILFKGTPGEEEPSEIIERLIYPKGTNRTPLPTEVPPSYATDYNEACLILSESPKASAALSRRCLQILLREKAQVKKSNLYDEIQEVLDSRTLPSDLSEGIDAVRHIGNFATHPIKSQHSGEIVEVEPGEAEWSLSVLEGLFDFYFVRPAKLKAQKAALNKKLKESGKPEMK